MTPRRSVGRWIRAWARLMARLYPPNWSSAQRADLADLLVDAASHPLLAYVTRNTLICARDAAFEWMSAGVRAPRWGDGMGAFTTELKQALRGLLRRPGYTIRGGGC